MDYDREVVLEGLINDIINREKIDKKLRKIDFIVFSGDLVYSGESDEFEAAAKHFLEPILKAAGVSESRLFMVPGNHDLKQSTFTRLPKELQSNLTQREEIQKWLTCEENRKHIMVPFEDYQTFIKKYFDGTLSAYASYCPLSVDGSDILLMGFNSALMCARGNDDYGKLIVGEPQIQECLKKKELKSPDLTIAVMHHHISYLLEKDKVAVEARLKKNVDIILCGHCHRSGIEIHGGPDGDCVIIPAGAAYNRRLVANPNYIPAYNFVTVKPDSRSGTIFLRKWREEDHCWAEHIRETHPEGCYSFSFSRLATSEDSVAPASRLLNDGLHFSLDNPVFNVPHRSKGEGMVGRKAAMKQLRRQLSKGVPTAIGHAAAFQGVGGLGKTQLAVEYATRYKEDYPGGVIWIDADFDIDSQLIKIAQEANWIAPESDRALILNVATRRLKTRSDCLIIYDNVENREDIDTYLPENSATPHLLLTSRSIQEGFTPIRLELLDSDLSLQLLLSEAGRPINTLIPQEQQAALEIADTMDGLPLAIEIAGAYLRHVTGCSFMDYKTMMKVDHLFKQVRKGELPSSLTKHERNLYITLQISEHELKKAPLLKEILDLLAWSGDDFMGISLMAVILDKKEVELLNALCIGTSLNILHKEKDERRYSIHRLVRHVRQKEFPIYDRKEWVKKVCSRLVNWFEGKREDFNNLLLFEAELEHLTTWQKHDSSFDSTYSVQLAFLQFFPYRHRGKYQDGKNVIQNAYELFHKQSNPNKGLKGNILNELGFIYNHIGRYEDALQYNEQALEIRRELFGEYHADTARSLYNVSSVNSKMGNYEIALKHQKKALKIRKKIFGNKNPETAKSLNHIGGIYSQLGEHETAINYLKQALNIRSEIFGRRHPDTARSLNSIGVALSKNGKHNEALNSKMQALEIQRERLGINHPETALSISNIGFTYYNLGKHDLALDYSKQALRILEKLFGEDHPDSARSINNVGLSHDKLENHREALKYLEKALKIRQKVLGYYHPETAESIKHVIHTLANLKKFKDR